MNTDSNTNIEERKWLAQHLAGDKQAFAKLMQAYRKPIYSYLVRCGLDKNQRDDLFQDIFFKIHKSAHSYNQQKRLSPWLFTLAVNTVRNHIRDQKPDEKHLSLVEEVSLKLVDRSPSPEKTIQSQEMIYWLQQAMNKLPVVQSEALNLAIIQGMKIKQVAEILKLPENTVKTHVRRARQSLIQSYNINDKKESNRSVS